VSAADREAAWLRLREASLVEGEIPPPGAHSSPWYVRAMLGIAGWIGALFLLAFIALGLVTIIKSSTAAIVVGAVFCAAAFAMFRFAKDNVFVTQFALAVSLAGQALFIFGIASDMKTEGTGFAMTIFVLEGALAVAVPNFIHRVLTTYAATMALEWVLGSFGAWTLAPIIPATGIAVIWLDESLWARRASVWAPIGYGLVLAMLSMSAMFMVGSYAGFSFPGMHQAAILVAPWLGRVVIAGLLVWAVVRLLHREGVELGSKPGTFALVLVSVVALASLLAPGVAGALLLILLGFATSNRILLALGFVAFAAFLSNYYYRLDSTLLVKSMVLMGLGAGILGARVALDRMLGPEKEGADA
jgi:uncharacterized membrane protein